jgi:hypothetical protein
LTQKHDVNANHSSMKYCGHLIKVQQTEHVQSDLLNLQPTSGEPESAPILCSQFIGTHTIHITGCYSFLLNYSGYAVVDNHGINEHKNAVSPSA